MSTQDAAGITSIALWISIFSVPVGGYLLQHSARPRLLANLSYLAAGLALLAFYLGAWPILACVAFGLVLGPGPGDLTAMPSRVLRPEHRITGLAIFATLNSAIMGIGPMIAGMLADAAHSPAAALLLGVAMMVACVPLTILFEATLRRSSSD
jgi:predicted MFS family arabinose efflux permease